MKHKPESGYWTVEGETISRGPDVRPVPADRRGQAVIFIASLAAEVFALVIFRQAFEMMKWSQGAAIDILAIGLVGSVWTVANAGIYIWNSRAKWPDEIQRNNVGL